MSTWALSRSKGRLAARIAETVARARSIDLARNAQVHFKRQVQEWKDVLLRGHNRADYDKYFGLFEMEEARTQGLLLELRNTEPSEAEAAGALIAKLQSLGLRYREALTLFDAQDPVSPRAVDRRVRGMDRATTDEMTALVNRLQQRMEAGSTNMAAAHEREMATLRHASYWAAIMGVVSSVMLMLLIRRTERERAQASDEAKRVFLATMSHEIRTPMNAVVGMAHLLGRTSLTTTQTNYLNRLQTASNQLLTIINDLLDLSKIEANRLELEHVPFSLDGVLDDVVALLGVRAAEKDLELVLWREPRVPLGLVGDPLRLSQILINLVGNAVKFTERGEVRISVETVELGAAHFELRFEVRDTGIGLTPEQQARLFQPFTQADQSTTRRFGGTGMGLAICKRLVGLMGGTIGVTSQPDQGSCFYFQVPFRLREDERRQHVRMPASVAGRRVAVMEPNAAAAQSLVGTLSAVGLTADALPCPRPDEVEAWSAEVDLVIVSWRQPGGNARPLLERIRRTGALPPYRVLVTASHVDAEVAHGVLAGTGMGVLFLKPASPSALCDAIARAFGVEQRTSTRRRSDHPDGPRLWTTLQGVRVLLVEDNQLNREVAVELLSTVGVAIDVVGDGPAALARIRDELEQGHCYDAVLLDRHMPGIDGLETCRRIRADSRCASLPIIAMTADAVGVSREECLAAGMNDFMSKPFSPSVLFETLARWTGRNAAPVPQPVGSPSSAPNVIVPAHIAGIDVERALSYLGGRRDLFLTVLRRFRAEQAGAADTVAALWAKGAHAEATRHVHTLRGLAAGLAADGLDRAATQLETALGASDEGQFRTALAVLSRELRIVVDGAYSAGLGPAQVGSQRRRSTPSALFARLGELVGDHDPEALTFIDELLGWAAAGARPKAEHMAACLRQYDFDAAQRLLPELGAEIATSAATEEHAS